MDKHIVKEDGKNGTVHFEGTALIRTVKKLIGKDDTQTIPLRSISSVILNRRTLGADIVIVTVGHRDYEWKSPTASEIADYINTANL